MGCTQSNVRAIVRLRREEKPISGSHEINFHKFLRFLLQHKLRVFPSSDSLLLPLPPTKNRPIISIVGLLHAAPHDSSPFTHKHKASWTFSHQVIEGVQDHLVQHGGPHDYSRLHDRNGQPSWREMSKGVLAVTEQLAPWSRDIFIFHFSFFSRSER